MSESVTVLIVIVVALISLALGYLQARSRASAGLAAAALQIATLQGRLESTAQHAASLEAKRAEQAELANQLAPMAAALQGLDARVIAAERDRAAAAAGLERLLKEQQEQTVSAATEVRREASKLAQALSRTHKRGSWGEAELRRLVEAAGMLERVHFDNQVTHRTADDQLRPDMVIYLAGDRSIVVDAKAPLDALISAMDEDSDSYSAETLQRHAKALRDHVDALAKRNYASIVKGSADHVVLYLPAESLLSLALTADPALLDHAFGKGITLATPTTMMALLRSVAQYWRDEALAENAAKIRDEGIALHDRLAKMAGHLSALGRSLEGAVKAFNGTVGSYETRVLPSSRRFSELGLVKEPIAAPAEVEGSPRTLKVAQLDLTDARPLSITEAEAAG